MLRVHTAHRLVDAAHRSVDAAHCLVDVAHRLVDAAHRLVDVVRVHVHAGLPEVFVAANRVRTQLHQQLQLKAIQGQVHLLQAIAIQVHLHLPVRANDHHDNQRHQEDDERQSKIHRFGKTFECVHANRWWYMHDDSDNRYVFGDDDSRTDDANKDTNKYNQTVDDVCGHVDCNRIVLVESALIVEVFFFRNLFEI